MSKTNHTELPKELVAVLVDEILERYGNLVYPHAVYRELKHKDAGFWKNMRSTLIKTFTMLLTQQAREILAQFSDLEEVMRNIAKNDKTPRYRYSGLRRFRADSRGEIPDKGRWLTPTEIAENYLQRAKLSSLRSKYGVESENDQI